MSPLVRLDPTTEGRRGSRLDLEEGRRYLGIPRNRSVRAFTSVQGTGCGTLHVNLKTAKDLRLTIPQSLLLRADKIIQ